MSLTDQASPGSHTDWIPVPEQEILTGERFQAIADVAVTTREKRAFHLSAPTMRYVEFGAEIGPDQKTMATLADAKVIFVYGDLVSDFFNAVLARLSQPVVLITHNSDQNIDQRFLPHLEGGRLIHWFAQNAAIRHPRLTPLPIGQANAQWKHGSTSALAETARQGVGRSRKEGLYVNFETSTNPAQRVPILRALHQKPFAIGGRKPPLTLQLMRLFNPGIRFSPRRPGKPLPYQDYLAELAQWRFCVSPPGNGLDCHRTWEALYLGVVPVLAADIPLLLDNLPHVVVKDFQNLSYDRLLDDLRGFASWGAQDRLRLSYWKLRIRSAAA